MTFQVVSGTLASDVANAGTFTVAYPAGFETGSFYRGINHKFLLGQNTALSFPNQFSLTFGAPSITVTNRSGATWVAGTGFRLQLEEQGKRAYKDDVTGSLLKRASLSPVMIINLGAADTADADGVYASAALTLLAGAGQALTGALVVSGVAVMDVPRNIVAAWTGDAVLTVTGKDEYGNVMVEKSASGTSLTGKKAFKQVTSIAVSADVTGLTVGTGDVLGVPVFIPTVANILVQLQDGAVATAGTFVGGVQTAGGTTATDGDVRGTMDPNAACDGAKVFQLIVSLPDPGYLGMSQYTG